MKKEERVYEGHVLLLPFHGQGHMNPMEVLVPSHLSRYTMTTLKVELQDLADSRVSLTDLKPVGPRTCLNSSRDTGKLNILLTVLFMMLT